jgi:hypothetical protein
MCGDGRFQLRACDVLKASAGAVGPSHMCGGERHVMTQEDAASRQRRALERLEECVESGTTPPDAEVEELFDTLKFHPVWVETYGKKYQSLPAPDASVAWEQLRRWYAVGKANSSL